MNHDGSRGVAQLICGPIGNLGDITYRAVECLRRADVIACEDTRHTRKLLSHYEIQPAELISLHEHNEVKRSEQLAEQIAGTGIVLAVISDAGTPAISDPGYRLVQACIGQNVRVEVIPGPSAVVTGLVGSGLATDQFCYAGFLPVKGGKKERVLQEALDRKGTSIFFESPHRIAKTLAVLAKLDPDRPICVARELTKKFETYHRGTASEIATELGEKVKGEITLLVQGQTRKKRVNS